MKPPQDAIRDREVSHANRVIRRAIGNGDSVVIEGGNALGDLLGIGKTAGALEHIP
jgi:2-phosphoglycerate kinase